VVFVFDCVLVCIILNKHQIKNRLALAGPKLLKATDEVSAHPQTETAPPDRG